ncbi:MAG: hypothetical protein FJ033_16460 [Chloroflexi bacterium]|nr:hypothetical protein [Chloroflexota bacterium]
MNGSNKTEMSQYAAVTLMFDRATFRPVDWRIHARNSVEQQKIAERVTLVIRLFQALDDQFGYGQAPQ